MKNLKPAWKLFFTMLKQNKLIWLVAVFAVFGIATGLLVGLEGEPVGNEDHLISAAFVVFSYYIIFFGLYLVFVNFINNRFFISCPETKTVLTRILPVCGFVINLSILLITVISAISGGYTAQMLSDILLFSALGILAGQFSVCLTCIRSGIAVLYACLVPYIAIIFTAESTSNEFFYNLHRNGFGVPVEISAVICAVVTIVGFALSFKLSEKAYGRRNTKLMLAAAQNPMTMK